jgi:hypothetical protein
MKIDTILKNVVGNYGLASSNKYHVSISNMGVGLGTTLGLDNISDPSVFELEASAGRAATKLSYLCDECNIPGFSFATGDVKGLSTGINIRHAHTKVFNELSLTFLLDMSHTTYNVFQNWSDYIFNRQGPAGYSKESYSSMQYYDNYCADIVISKLEPNRRDLGVREFFNIDGKVSSRNTHSVVNTVVAHKAFPYSMNNLSFSNGPNQPVRIQVSFYFEYLDRL